MFLSVIYFCMITIVALSRKKNNTCKYKVQSFVGELGMVGIGLDRGYAKYRPISLRLLVYELTSWG